MRSTDEIVRETYDQNRTVFNDEDRAAAQTALDYYMFEINGAGLRCEFDYDPSRFHFILDRVERHRAELGYLRKRVDRFQAFIELMERLQSRTAVQLNPLWWHSDNAAETITRTIEPQAIITYRAFHAALVAYLDALAKKNADPVEIAECARGVARTVYPQWWQEEGATTSERCVTDFGTRWFLEAVLD